MMFGWLWHKALQSVLPESEEDLQTEREEAAKARERAEGALRDEVSRTADVAKVAAVSRRLRAQNNFGLRVAESFRGHNGSHSG